MRCTTGSTGVTFCGKHGDGCAATVARQEWMGRRFRQSNNEGVEFLAEIQETLNQDLPAATSQAARIHSESQRKDETAGDTDGARPGGADGGGPC